MDYKNNGKYIMQLGFMDLEYEGYYTFIISSKVDGCIIHTATHNIINKYNLKSIDTCITKDKYLDYKNKYNIYLLNLKESYFINNKCYIDSETIQDFIIFLLNKDYPEYEVELIELPYIALGKIV